MTSCQRPGGEARLVQRGGADDPQVARDARKDRAPYGHDLGIREVGEQRPQPVRSREDARRQERDQVGVCSFQQLQPSRSDVVIAASGCGEADFHLVRSVLQSVERGE